MSHRPSRRDFLEIAAASAAAGLAAPLSGAAEAPAPPGAASAGKPAGFDICLNTATIREQKPGLAKVVEMAAAAGYQGVELWHDELDQYQRSGGSLSDLGARARDRGIAFPDAIAFFEWMVDDDARRAKGLEDARRAMDALAKIGCRHVAAPPAGMGKAVDLFRVVERYRELLAIGEGLGVAPILELWGSSPALSRLGQAALVVIEAGHPAATLLPDVFHLHKGGSGFEGVQFLRGSTLGILHLNDYPAAPPVADLRDSHRVFPGDGVAPLAKLLRDLRAIGYSGMLSLEVFNPEYYRRDPEDVVREGYRKCRAVVEAALR